MYKLVIHLYLQPGTQPWFLLVLYLPQPVSHWVLPFLPSWHLSNSSIHSIVLPLPFLTKIPTTPAPTVGLLASSPILLQAILIGISRVNFLYPSLTMPLSIIKPPLLLQNVQWKGLLSTELQNSSLAVSPHPTSVIKLPIPSKCTFQKIHVSWHAWFLKSGFFFFSNYHMCFLGSPRKLEPTLKTWLKPSLWRKVLYDVFRQDKSLLPASSGEHGTMSYNTHPVSPAYLELPYPLFPWSSNPVGWVTVIPSYRWQVYLVFQGCVVSKCKAQCSVPTATYCLLNTLLYWLRQ